MIRRHIAPKRSGGLRSAAATPGGQGRAGAHRGSAMSADSAPAASTFARFLWIFTTFGIIVIAVVIGFLIGIVRALESIDNGLFT
ncbi:MAG: hypothetical protein M3300_00930, partial [Actinomycetota bacterium]|nr:hypothetical protein [Actinomycetota bacterium]